MLTSTSRLVVDRFCRNFQIYRRPIGCIAAAADFVSGTQRWAFSTLARATWCGQTGRHGVFLYLVLSMQTTCDACTLGIRREYSAALAPTVAHPLVCSQERVVAACRLVQLLNIIHCVVLANISLLKLASSLSSGAAEARSERTQETSEHQKTRIQEYKNTGTHTYIRRANVLTQHVAPAALPGCSLRPPSRPAAKQMHMNSYQISTRYDC
jgi:hypothetical protein